MKLYRRIPVGTRENSPGIEARYNDDGTLDEVVATGKIHIEQMDDNHWWIGITTEDGKVHHVNIHTRRAKISARCEFDL